MTLFCDILNKQPKLKKSTQTYILKMVASLMAFQGRANATNLARFNGPSPRNQYRHQRADIDFSSLNADIIRHSGFQNDTLLLALDASFVPKSGKHTEGIDSFFCSAASRHKIGMEISQMALVSVNERTAYPFDVQQTPSKEGCPDGKMAFYLKQVRDKQHLLPESTNYLLVDGAYANKTFVDGIRETLLHIVGRMRKDANLREMAPPRKKGQRGRPPKYGKKSYGNDLSSWNPVAYSDEKVALWTQRAWHVSLQREIQVVRVQKSGSKDKEYVYIYSTDLNLPPKTIYDWYRLRFQIEFLFRDGKQHLGLSHGQMRSKTALKHHFSLCMLTLLLLRLERRNIVLTDYSVGSLKRIKANENLWNQIKPMLDFPANQPKMQELEEKVRFYGLGMGK